MTFLSGLPLKQSRQRTDLARHFRDQVVGRHEPDQLLIGVDNRGSSHTSRPKRCHGLLHWCVG